MTKTKLMTALVDPENKGMRLDKFLSIRLPFSRSRIAALIENGHVLPSLAADTKVKPGQVFTVNIPEAIEATPRPQKIELNILYEDADLIVIDKPAGMVVHPGAGNFEGTLVNALLAHCGNSLSGIGGVKRPGIVHRIDKETSGILAIAKNDMAHQKLSEQFACHSIQRVYQAVVYGIPLPQGKIEGNIGRSPRNRQKMAIVSTGGKPAVTHYKLIKKLYQERAALIECRLETGRTHQIRVHMTSIGHPLVGDKTYGNPPKGTPDILRQFPRQALHAAVLTFVHPRTGETLSFSTPLPEDMSCLVKNG